MNGFNLSTISDLYVGSTQYSAIYLGLQKIWERNTEYINQYLTIESLEDNNVISFTSSTNQTVQRTIYVNKNNTGWYSVTSGPQIQVATLNTGDKLKIYGSSSTYTYSKDGTTNNSCIFGSTKTVNLYGNICTLLTDGNIPTSSIDLSGSQYNYCFANIFIYLKVVDASNLIFGAIDKMGYYTCHQMFKNCTSLTVAPELPTIDLGDLSLTISACYQYMFTGCTSLITGPSILPAIIAPGACYSNMFYGCSSLTTAPILPATSLGRQCYSNMFKGCSSLTTAPELPAIALVKECYQYMFEGCTSLITAPSILPATTLATSCYRYMFNWCSSLTTAPVLPATTLVKSCYMSMFNGCSSLNYIKALFTSTTDSTLGYTGNWVTDVAASGTFIKSPDATWNITGNNGVPTGWTTSNLNMQRLTIESLEDNNVIDFTSAADATVQRTINVRINSSEWYSVTSGPDTTIATLNTGDKLEIYGSGSTYTYSKDGTINNSCIFGSSKTVNLYGNIGCLLTNGDLPYNMDLSGSKYNYCFAWLFSNLQVVDASNLVFPITKIPYYGLRCMFYYCRNLVYAPTILPATTLKSHCYDSMFYGCTNLKSAPVLPATTLKTACYTYMFKGCTSLTTAPELPATTLVTSCYSYMFDGCTSLKTIKALCTTTPIYLYTENWVLGVSDKGTFIKSSEATWTTTGNNGVPSGWTIITQ